MRRARNAAVKRIKQIEYELCFWRSAKAAECKNIKSHGKKNLPAAQRNIANHSEILANGICQSVHRNRLFVEHWHTHV